MIFLIRHGQTDYNIAGKIQGARIDVPLNDSGIKEAQELRDIFKGHEFDAVITSPLQRAVDSAKIISQDCTVNKFITDSRFLERNFGSLEGTISQAPNFKYYFSHKIEDGESPEDLYNRIYTALKEIACKYNGDVLIVSHGAITGSYVSNQIGDDNIKIKNTSCVLIDSNTGDLIDFNVDKKRIKEMIE